ncbi:MAG: hypothetical protein ACE5OZ_12725 [Candidatus Heimdallarchaeota archaeon]
MGTTKLTWQTDPLLVDPEPVSWPHWVTANQLLGKNSAICVPSLFLQSPQLNFYGIMVRKSDFVKKSPRDRLLTRFPYLCMAQSCHFSILQFLVNLLE